MKNIRDVLTPARVLVGAFLLLFGTMTFQAMKPPTPGGVAPVELEIDEETLAPEKTDFATVTGPKVVYVVPEETGRITARIKNADGALVREFVITNWVTIRPGQHLELTAEPARKG